MACKLLPLQSTCLWRSPTSVIGSCVCIRGGGWRGGGWGVYCLDETNQTVGEKYPGGGEVGHESIIPY